MRQPVDPQRKAELSAKGAHLRALMDSPGWPVLKELLEMALRAESSIEDLAIDKMPAEEIAIEVRARARMRKRLRIFVENMLSLVETSNNLRRIEAMQRESRSIFKTVRRETQSK